MFIRRVWEEPGSKYVRWTLS